MFGVNSIEVDCSDEGVFSSTTYKQKHFDSPATVVHFNPLGFLPHDNALQTQNNHQYQQFTTLASPTDSQNHKSDVKNVAKSEKILQRIDQNISRYSEGNGAMQKMKKQKQLNLDLVFGDEHYRVQDIHSRIIKPRSYHKPQQKFRSSSEEKITCNESGIPRRSKKIENQNQNYRSTIQRAIGKQGPTMKETFRKNQDLKIVKKDRQVQPERNQVKVPSKITQKSKIPHKIQSSPTVNVVNSVKKSVKSEKNINVQNKNQTSNLIIKKASKLKTKNQTTIADQTNHNLDKKQNILDKKFVNTMPLKKQSQSINKVQKFKKIDEDIENRQTVVNINKIVQKAREDVKKICKQKCGRQEVQKEKIDINIDKYLKSRSLLALNVMTKDKKEIGRLKDKFSLLEDNVKQVFKKLGDITEDELQQGNGNQQ